MKVYLDNASTTPIDPKVFFVMKPFLMENYGNPSSLHYPGRVAKNTIEKSRENLARIIGAEKDEIIFTGGGTESDNLAIFGIARANKFRGKHIIISNIEHKAVLDSCKKLEQEGFEISYLKVDKNGLVHPHQLRKMIRSDTVLVSIMYANNEIGTIQPISKLSKIIKQSKKNNPIFHSDACQACGALPIDVKKLGVDALTISASKIYGPKGVGCLYLNKRFQVEPIIFGGGQEKGLRSGTENAALIVGFSEALSVAERKRISESERLKVLRNYFYDQVKKRIKGVTLNGSKSHRLPNNLNISVRGVEGESLVLLLDEKGVYCSTGSACSSADLNPSHVLVNIGLPLELAHCSVRFTLGRSTTKKALDYVVLALEKSIKKIRSISSLI